ncbi:MAG: hypothetical protein WCK74_04480 [Gemmatimonadaceae bacterium]
MTHPEFHPIPGPIPNTYRVGLHQLYGGEYPGAKPMPDTASANDKLAALLDNGVNVFIDLTEAHELDPYHQHATTGGEARGMTVLHERHAIRDVSTCPPEQMQQIVARIDEHLDAGRTVYVHCWGGIGRTGMVLGCWMVNQGVDPDTALSVTQAGFDSMAKRSRFPASRRSPETDAQQAVVRSWATRG